MLIKSFFSLSQISKETQLSIAELAIFIVIIATVFFLQLSGVELLLVKTASNFSIPLLTLQLKIASSVTSLSGVVKQQHQLARKVQDLELRLSRATAGLGELDQLQNENQALRNLLNSTDRSLGRVILTQPILSYAQPVIGLPKDEEVAVGSAVTVEGTLVGLIKEVKQDIAYIDLLWQKNIRPVLATTETGVQGVVIGDGRRVLLTEVQVDENLEVGQRVVAAGQKGVDKGVLIGEIRSIRTSASDATKTAVIEQFVSFYDAHLVEIRL